MVVVESDSSPPCGKINTHDQLVTVKKSKHCLKNLEPLCTATVDNFLIKVIECSWTRASIVCCDAQEIVKSTCSSSLVTSPLVQYAHTREDSLVNIVHNPTIG